MAKTMSRKNLIRKKLFLVLLGIAVIFAAIPAVPVHAEEIPAAPAITIGEQTVYAGSSGTIYVNGSNFQRVTALKISVRYNPEILSVGSVSKGGLLSGSVSDVNCSESGLVKLSAISSEGISGSGLLLGISFYAQAGAEAGDYPMELIVEEAYAIDESPEDESEKPKAISVTKGNGRLTVKEQEETLPTAYFYGSLSKYSPKEGETFDYYLRSNNVGNLAGGNFEFTYDREHLELTNAELGTRLTAANCTASVNRKTAGYVKVSFAATAPLSPSYGETLVKLTFKAIATEAASTLIEFSPGELQEIKADDTLRAMNSSGSTCTVNITREVVVVQNPKFRMEYEELSHGETYQVTAMIEGESELAAGDFAITYDKDLSLCTEVAICTATGDEDSQPGTGESLIITKPKIDQGTVGFSFVNTAGITEDQRLIVMTFKRLKAGETGVMRVSGSQTVKNDYSKVSINYPELVIDFSHYLKTVEIKAKQGSNDTFIEKLKCTGCDYEETREVSGLSGEIVNVHFDTKGISGQTTLALYAKDSEINEIGNDMIQGAAGALAQVKCEPGTTGAVSLGVVPAGEYLAAVYNSQKGLYYNKIEIGTGGETVGLAADIACIVQTGVCNLHTFTYGDVDGSGKIDFADVLWAKRYLAGWTGYENAEKFAIDVDCDGTPDIDDITYIARYLAGWQGYKTLPVTS